MIQVNLRAKDNLRSFTKIFYLSISKLIYLYLSISLCLSGNKEGDRARERKGREGRGGGGRGNKLINLKSARNSSS